MASEWGIENLRQDCPSMEARNADTHPDPGLTDLMVLQSGN